MGEVFLAWDERLERRVAIKRIRQGSPEKHNQHERFLREARSAARLSHSAIVQIHELIPDISGDAIVMEYVEGVTLGDSITAGPLSVREALRLAREIAEGLAAAHAAGFIHRDLKPENVIITPQGQAKILDFGLVKPLTPDPEDQTLTRQGILLGTFPSMSPEQACCEPVDERSDLFSLGVLLYEMLSGHAPFRGKNAADTLKRVITSHPPALSSVRDSIPQDVSDLVDRLLAKSRDDRPPNARAVIRRLQDLEADLPVSSSDSASEMVTADWSTAARKNEGQTHPLTSTGGMSINRRRRHIVAVWVVAVVAVLLGTAVFLVRRNPSRPIRVVVLRPEVLGAQNDPAAELTASGILAFSPGIIASFEGLVPIDPPQPLQTDGSHAEIAKAVGADEVVTGTVEPNVDGMAQVTLKCTQARDDTILWSRIFPVRTGPSDLHLLSDALTAQLRRAYSDKVLRPGALDLKVSDEDYAELLAIKKHRDEGSLETLAADLSALDRLLRSSPNFLEAKIQAAKISLYLYKSQHDQHFVEKAREIIKSAENLAPGEPRVLMLVVQCDLEEGKMEDAERTLQRLDQLLPGDPDVAALHASLAEKQGRIEDAITDLRTTVHLAPTWQNLSTLAGLEAQTGQISEARQHFELILEQSHNNAWAIDGLARIELFYGDLDRARKRFEDLARNSSQSRSFVNLGFANFLLHQYEPAAKAFHQALSIEPASAVSLLDLADTELEMGRPDEANAHYQQALRSLDESPKGILTPMNRMVKAQCLAHTKSSREAVQIVEETLRQSPNTPERLFEAALVHCLANQRDSSISYTKAALEKKVQPSWFYAYGCFRSDPEIQHLLEAAREFHPSH